MEGWKLFTIVVIVVGAAIGAVVWLEDQPGGLLNPTPATRVTVAGVEWTDSGKVLQQTAGFSTSPGSAEWVSVTLTCSPATGASGPVPENCSSGSASVETAGFGLVSTNAPVDWSSGKSGATATVKVEVSTPTHSFDGMLTVELRATFG